MSIDTQVVDKLAELSRLEFSPEAKAEIASELENILGFISQLKEVDTEDVRPMTSVLNRNDQGEQSKTRERADEVTEEDMRDAYQEIAPDGDMGFYVVPQVIE